MSVHTYFTGLVATECVKLRRGAAPVVAVLMPLAAVFFSLLWLWGNGLRQTPATLLASFHEIVLYLWAAFLLPSLVALQAGFLCAVEHRDHQWKHLYAMPFPRWWALAAKLVVLEGLMIGGAILLWLMVIAGGELLALAGSSQSMRTALRVEAVGSLASTIGLLTLTTTAIAPLHLWIASVSTPAVIPPVIATFASILCVMSNTSGWTKLIPWGFALQLLRGQSVGQLITASLSLGSACFIAAVWHHQIRDVPS